MQDECFLLQQGTGQFQQCGCYIKTTPLHFLPIMPQQALAYTLVQTNGHTGSCANPYRRALSGQASR